MDYAAEVYKILRGAILPDTTGWPPDWVRIVKLADEAQLSFDDFYRMVLAEFNGTGQPYVDAVRRYSSTPADSARQGEMKRVFTLFTPEQIRTRPPKKWIVKNFLGEHDFAMIFGPSGRGKTFVTFDLILSLVSQSRFADYFDITRPAKVLYCTDEGIEGLPARLIAVEQKYGVQASASWLRFCLLVPQLFMDIETNTNQFITDVLAAATDFKPDFVVIDTLFNATVGAKENVADDASIAIHNAKTIRDTLDCGIILLHHSNKAGEWPRGTSAWIGSMDLIVQIDNNSFSCFKAKDAPSFTSLTFELESTGDSAIVNWAGIREPTELLGEAAYQYLLGQPNVKVSAKELADMFEVHQTSLKRELDKYVKRGLVQSALKLPNSPGSKFNPTVYWVPDPRAGITFGGLNVPTR